MVVFLPMLSPISIKMQEGIESDVFPGGELLIAYKNTVCFHKAFGLSQRVPEPIPLTVNSFFDLASLTKPLATASAITHLIDKGAFNLEDPVSKFIVEYKKGGKEKVTLAHLLVHNSGLPDWKPYYEAIRERNEKSPGFIGSDTAKQAVYQMSRDEPLVSTPGTDRRYSDIGFILLGEIVERVSQVPLDQFCDNEIFCGICVDGQREDAGAHRAPLRENVVTPAGCGRRSEEIFFQPFGRERAGRFVATEQCPWRNEVLKGKVHDDNCYVMGGVAGHAGLFGTARAVYAIVQDYMTTPPNPQRPTEAVRSLPPVGVGWDTPSLEGSSSGRFFSKSSFGHLGFTGTSIWVDPVNALVVILLTNRVHPSRNNERIRQFRPEIHDIIFQEVIGV